MVFKNDIYSGKPEGFYEYERLDSFLKNLPNVSESIYDQKYEAKLFAHKISGVPIFAFYNFRVEDEKVVDHLDVYSITDTDGFGEIETLILEEARNFK